MLYKGLGVYGRDYVPWEAELMQPVRASNADFGEEGPDGQRVIVRFTASFTTGAEIAGGEELILITPGEFNALRLMFAAMAVSLLYRGGADLYEWMFGIGYGPL
jgi:hypothetical protein